MSNYQKLEIWVVAYKRFYAFWCSWRFSWEETWFPRKLKAGGEKITVGNKRLSIIYWKACWRNFHMTKPHMWGLVCKGPPPPTGELYHLQQLTIIAASSINMNLSFPAGIRIWSSYLILSSQTRVNPSSATKTVAVVNRWILVKVGYSFDCTSLDANWALYLLLMLLTFLLPEELE